MRFMLLIYTPEKLDPDPGSAAFGEMMAGYGAFTAEVRGNGMFDNGDPLQPVATAKTVRVRDGEPLVMAGPFAETAEQLGGFYILNCKDIDEAVAYAAKIPGAKLGSIEVRPIMEMG
ncbi:MAG: YciI family protein [Dehalococcoidia bacterium]